jgi:hypothetical protein
MTGVSLLFDDILVRASGLPFQLSHLPAGGVAKQHHTGWWF